MSFIDLTDGPDEGSSAEMSYHESDFEFLDDSLDPEGRYQHPFFDDFSPSWEGAQNYEQTDENFDLRRTIEHPIPSIPASEPPAPAPAPPAPAQPNQEVQNEPARVTRGNPQSCNWMVTGNIDDDSVWHDNAYVKMFINSLPNNPRGWIFQYERGEEEHLHFHLVLRFWVNVRFNRLKEAFENHLPVGLRPRLEKCRSLVDSVQYASKEETRVAGPWSFGELPVKKDKSHAGLIKRIKEGAKFQELSDEFPSLVARNPGNIRALQAELFAHPQSARFPKQNVIFIGNPGCGKSSIARSELEVFEIPYYSKRPGKWWPKYDGEPAVIYDDFVGKDWITLTELLNWTDIYAVMNEAKGGHVNLTHQMNIFTTNIHPKYWYKWDNRSTQFKALARRINRVYIEHFQTSEFFCFRVLTDPLAIEHWFETNDIVGYPYETDFFYKSHIFTF